LSNFKITHIFMVIVGSRFYMFGILHGEGARCSPVRCQRCFATSACEWGSQLGFHRDVGFDYFFWGFIWEICCPFRWIQPRLMQTLYLLDHFGLYYHVLLFIIILFILCDLFIYLILAFRTHVSSCVRGRVVTPNHN
jgi:hypothetical protein